MRQSQLPDHNYIVNFKDTRPFVQLTVVDWLWRTAPGSQRTIPTSRPLPRPERVSSCCHLLPRTERVTAAVLQLRLGLDRSYVNGAWEAGMAREPPEDSERKEPVSTAVLVVRQKVFWPVLTFKQGYILLCLRDVGQSFWSGANCPAATTCSCAKASTDKADLERYLCHSQDRQIADTVAGRSAARPVSNGAAARADAQAIPAAPGVAAGGRANPV